MEEGVIIIIAGKEDEVLRLLRLLSSSFPVPPFSLWGEIHRNGGRMAIVLSLSLLK
jgi:hypothetical protein